MLPIVEIMTCNFVLLALDQIINNAATLHHMSGGQINIPIVIRVSTGAGRQLAAQHSHSWEGWFAHIPGIKIISPATVTDARYMLQAAIKENNPTILFEQAALYNDENELEEVKRVNLNKAKIIKSGSDVTLITYGASLKKCIDANIELEKVGVSAEVIDLRILRPLDNDTLFKSVVKTKHVVIVDEGWKSGSLSAEISSRITEEHFYDLDAPVRRVCSAEVPMPYARILEEQIIPSVSTIVSTTLEILNEPV
jgi:pyruvate dehydrogenase E1 component beta subunit